MGIHSTAALQARGLDLPVPDAVWIDEEVDLERIAHDATLHPGTRISGAETVIAEGAEVGALGPAVLHDVALGPGAAVTRGSAESCTLLDGASLGPDAHVRGGTLLEEQASTGHAVGLKQTILLAHATLGSVINFCDCLLYGGRHRKDHSEVGSGFIHFNFTPFGAAGDKATASLFGDVPRGVLQDDDRIFLGGAGGVVGPVSIGYGTVLAAGAVYRRDYETGLLVVGEDVRTRTLPFDAKVVRRRGEKVARSVAYVAQLHALDAWYEHIRVPAATGLSQLVAESARRRLASGIAERIKQVGRLLSDEGELRERWASVAERLGGRFEGDAEARDRAAGTVAPRSHGDWVRGLDEVARQAVTDWLQSVVDEVVAVWE